MEPAVARRKFKRINRKTKVNLVFDEEARKEYLTGFHKRKLQRKKRAEEEFQTLLKEERKRIKLESKAQYKKLVKSYQPIPELEEQFAKEYQLQDSTVSVLELDTDLLSSANLIIGRNRGQEQVKEENVEVTHDNSVQGMDLKLAEDTSKTGKEIKREIKKQATKTVKKSKVFQKKNKLEKQKQRKKAKAFKTKSNQHNAKKGRRKGRAKRGPPRS